MSGNAEDRRPVGDEYVRDAEKQVLYWLQKRLDAKGKGTIASRHELLGLIQEEYHELTMAVHQGEPLHIHAELVDIAVACIFGIACIKAQAMDW